MEQTPADILLRELMEDDDLEACLQRNDGLFLRKTVAQGLAELFQTRSISKAELARRSDVSLVYLHQVFAGKRTPSRDRLLGLCLALGASVEETQHLLLGTFYSPLNPLNRRDAVLIFALAHGMKLPEVRAALEGAGEPPLYGAV